MFNRKWEGNFQPAYALPFDLYFLMSRNTANSDAEIKSVISSFIIDLSTNTAQDLSNLFTDLGDNFPATFDNLNIYYPASELFWYHRSGNVALQHAKNVAQSSINSLDTVENQIVPSLRSFILKLSRNIEDISKLKEKLTATIYKSMRDKMEEVNAKMALWNNFINSKTDETTMNRSRNLREDPAEKATSLLNLNKQINTLITTIQLKMEKMKKLLQENKYLQFPVPDPDDQKYLDSISNQYNTLFSVVGNAAETKARISTRIASSTTGLGSALAVRPDFIAGQLSIPQEGVNFLRRHHYKWVIERNNVMSVIMPKISKGTAWITGVRSDPNRPTVIGFDNTAYFPSDDDIKTTLRNKVQDANTRAAATPLEQKRFSVSVHFTYNGFYIWHVPTSQNEYVLREIPILREYYNNSNENLGLYRHVLFYGDMARFTSFTGKNVPTGVTQDSLRDMISEFWHNYEPEMEPSVANAWVMPKIALIYGSIVEILKIFEKKSTNSAEIATIGTQIQTASSNINFNDIIQINAIMRNLALMPGGQAQLRTQLVEAYNEMIGSMTGIQKAAEDYMKELSNVQDPLAKIYAKQVTDVLSRLSANITEVVKDYAGSR